MAFFGFLTVLGSIVGALVLFAGVTAAKGAPQEAAAAAIAIAMGVLPYVVFRVFQTSSQDKKRTAFYESVQESLQAIEKKD